MIRRSGITVVSLLVVVLSVILPVQGQPQSGNVVPNSYICLVDNTEDALDIGQAAVKATGGVLGHVYNNTINGFSIWVPPGIVIANLRAQRGVINVEKDIVLQAFSSSAIIPTGVDRINAEGVNINCSSVGIAIIDTGIDIDHPDLNVQGGVHYYHKNPFRALQDNNYDDDHGHGTHVAGTAAAKGIGVVGIAPNARLYAVKVLNANGSGYMSDILAGIEWVADNASILGISVANLSLGGAGQWSQAFYDALNNDAVSFTIAAGNNARDIFSSTYDNQIIPAIYGAFLGNVYTISALADSDGKPGGLGDPTTSYGYADDSFANFSNYSFVRKDQTILGRFVGFDPIAYILPGVDITSTYPGGQYASGWSGTSMAAPHAAGLLALSLAEGNVNLDGDSTVAMGLYHRDDPDGYYEPLPYANYASSSEPDTTPPAAPTGLTATAGDSLVSLDWNDNDESDLLCYYVYRSESEISASTPLTDLTYIDLSTVSEYTDNTVSNGNTYYYVVTAIDTSGNQSGSSIQDSATPQISGGGGEIYIYAVIDYLPSTITKSAGPNDFGFAKAEITIIDEDTNPVDGAAVYGYWDGDDYASYVGSTAGSGVVSTESGYMKNPDSAAFHVTDVVKDGYLYVP